MKKKLVMMVLILPLLFSCGNNKVGSPNFDAVSYFFAEHNRCDQNLGRLSFRPVVNQDFVDRSTLATQLTLLLGGIKFTPTSGRVGRNLVVFDCDYYNKAEKSTHRASFYLADDLYRCSFSFVTDYIYSPTKEYAYALASGDGEKIISLLSASSETEGVL
jgi:hypothetical protein